MKNKIAIISLLLFITACNNDNNGGNNAPDEPSVKADVFVDTTKAILQMTAEDTEPLDLSDVNVTTPDDNEPVDVQV